MLAYRHLFHAGNFADVMKHALLARLLIALGRKDKPYCYIDTHAGTGVYDLTHDWATKNAEFEGGIAKIWKRTDVPALLAPYVQAVHAENTDGWLRVYPGSPWIAQRLLRPGDRMVLSDLQAADAETLQSNFASERNVSVLHQDADQTLKAHLPPKERRGLVLIDPSFDVADAFHQLVRSLRAAHTRWSTGVFAVWYPLMGPSTVRAFERSLIDTDIRKMLRIELSIHPENWIESLRGCGLLVINPPFGFEAEARSIVEWLAPALAGNEGHSKISWLTPE